MCGGIIGFVYETACKCELVRIDAPPNGSQLVATNAELRTFLALHAVKVGDTVCRYLGGVDKPFMELVVTAITNKTIVCGDYTFDRGNGGEIDEGLPLPPGVYASYIRPKGSP